MPHDLRMILRGAGHRIVALVMAGMVGAPASGEVPALLTKGAEILNLPEDEARKAIPIRTRGVVTYTESDWAGQFFIQDETGGVFVGVSGKPAPEIGQLLEVTGTSHPGAFAPYINEPKWEVLGTADLPEARAISMERFASGIDDGLRVEVRGRVRGVFTPNAGQWILTMASGGQRFEVKVRVKDGAGPPAGWVGALVRVRGVLAADYQLHRRGLAMVRIFVADPSEILVEQAEEIDPMSRDLVPLAHIGQYRRNLAPGQRSRVRGTVVALLGPDSLALEDESGGLVIKGPGLGGHVPGDGVEAVGFEGLEGFLPVLQDAVVKVTGENKGLPAPASPNSDGLSSGKFHACLVTLDADLLESSTIPAAGAGAGERQVLMVLRRDGRIFRASFPYTAPKDHEPLPFLPGSKLRLTGLCLAEADREGRVDSFKLLAGGADAVKVLAPPPWLTHRRLMTALFSSLAAITVFGGWGLSSYRKNRRLRAEIRERAKVTEELRAAQEQLSLRVDERTEQLELQISQRKEAEVRFEAIIGERTRLAEELHDGLQQGLTGVSLQLDTASRLRERLPEQSQHHLELARTLMRQTQVELRDSVWNLRSRGQKDFSLLEALRQSSHRLTEGTWMNVEVMQSGEPRPLSEFEEENLLRIGQEALTNAIKHSGAKDLEIHLRFEKEQLILEIHDSGQGFSAGEVKGPQQGHFGLSGMGERAQRIGGSLEIESRPGGGTSIRAFLPAAFSISPVTP